VILSYKKQILTWVVVAIWIFEFVPMMERLYFLAPNRYARFWSNMAKVVSAKVAADKSSFNYVIVSTDIDNVEYAYPIYNQIDSREIIANNKNRIQLDGHDFKKYGNVYLGTIPDGQLVNFLSTLSGKVMYVGPYSEANLFGLNQTLNDKDGIPSVFIIKK
jgi:hypothetical protein